MSQVRSGGNVQRRVAHAAAVSVPGADSAGTDIGQVLTQAAVLEGMRESEARRAHWLIRHQRSLASSGPDLKDFKKPFALDRESISEFVRVIEVLRPTGYTALVKLRAH